ncbi:hypothetical protein JOB18_037026 [Solea senegalensis]|uniref:Uncharacterized protein n=1 Tax=Solea senegalensis TaxID=28829 RepID=A0AAV6RDE5_SOLSE|nr:hypothetical protein JOB18_037026 [Solea senegalensis]
MKLILNNCYNKHYSVRSDRVDIKSPSYAALQGHFHTINQKPHGKPDKIIQHELSMSWIIVRFHGYVPLNMARCLHHRDSFGQFSLHHASSNTDHLMIMHPMITDMKTSQTKGFCHVNNQRNASSTRVMYYDSKTPQTTNIHQNHIRTQKQARAFNLANSLSLMSYVNQYFRARYHIEGTNKAESELNLKPSECARRKRLENVYTATQGPSCAIKARACFMHVVCFVAPGTSLATNAVYLRCTGSLGADSHLHQASAVQ